MAVSKDDICNTALTHISAATVEDVETDTSNEAILCRRFYDKAREIALRGFEWSFATRRVTLAEVELDDSYLEYAYGYTLPSDHLRTISIKSNGQGDIWDQTIENDGTQKILLTDCPEAVLRYIADIEDVTQFDSLFIQALEYQLAAKLAFPITKDQTVVNNMESKYRMTLGQAQQINDKEERPKRDDEDSWISWRNL